jgi:hypothetical protein
VAGADVKPYTVVSESHEVQWDKGLQEAVPGWVVKSIWNATNTVIPVFVPDSQDLNAGVDLLTRAKGAEIDRLRAPTT